MVIHTVAGLEPGHGGPSRTVVALADAQARQLGCRVGLASQGRRGAATVASAVPAVTRDDGVSDGWLALALGLPCWQALRRMRLGLTPDLIHSHGIWHPANHWAAREARRGGVPLVVQPRGMLEPWALGRKSLKKRLALAWYQEADLAQAATLVATSDMEYENLRCFGLRQPIAVIPNGITFPTFDQVGTSTTPHQVVERNVLFLSRIHPKKGVLELVRAWGRVAPAGWRLQIAGPDEGSHWADVARLVDQLGLRSVVDYLGPVEGERKAALYRGADLFVLPTFSENFGLVVAEALAYGVPVITTRGAPWADLETYGCGWWIDTGVEPLVSALRSAVALGDAERRAMGERGRAYVQRYDWDTIAAETLALYRWVLGRGGRPACVHLD